MTQHELRPQLSPERGYQQQEQVGWLRRFGAAVGLVAVTGIAAYTALDNYDGQSGEVRDYSVAADAGQAIEGTEETIVAAGEDGVAEDGVLTAEGSPADDGVLRVVTWNMHKETGQERRLDEVKSLLYEQKADAVLLQEVRAERAKELGEHLPGLEVRHVVGEALPGKEDLGNVIVTWEVQQDIESISLDGSSALESLAKAVTGGAQDVWDELFGDSDDPSWQRLNRSWQENRAAISVTIPVRIGDEILYVRITNTHLSHHLLPGQVKAGQVGQLDSYTTDTPEGVDVEVMCGDFNEPDYAETVQIFDQFLVLETDATFEKYGTTIDRCMLKPKEGLGAEAKTLEKYKTDHTAVEAEVYQEGHEQNLEDIVATDSTEFDTSALQN